MGDNSEEPTTATLPSSERESLVTYGLRVLQEMEAAENTTMHQPPPVTQVTPPLSTVESLSPAGHLLPFPTTISTSIPLTTTRNTPPLPSTTTECRPPSPCNMSPSPSVPQFEETTEDLQPLPELGSSPFSPLLQSTLSPLPAPGGSLAERVFLLEVELEVQREKYVTLERQMEHLSKLLNEKSGDESNPGNCSDPQTPKCPVPSTLSSHSMAMTEDNHFKPLQAIYANVMTISDSGEVTEGEINRNIVSTLAHLRGNPSSFGRALMKKCFTPFELATCNVRGVKKQPLDPVRISAIRKEVMTVCGVPLAERSHVWKQVVKAMDTANRNARRYMSFTL